MTRPPRPEQSILHSGRRPRGAGRAHAPRTRIVVLHLLIALQALQLPPPPRGYGTSAAEIVVDAAGVLPAGSVDRINRIAFDVHQKIRWRDGRRHLAGHWPAGAGRRCIADRSRVGRRRERRHWPADAQRRRRHPPGAEGDELQRPRRVLRHDGAGDRRASSPTPRRRRCAARSFHCSCSANTGRPWKCWPVALASSSRRSSASRSTRPRRLRPCSSPMCGGGRGGRGGGLSAVHDLHPVHRRLLHSE